MEFIENAATQFEIDIFVARTELFQPTDASYEYGKCWQYNYRLAIVDSGSTCMIACRATAADI